MKKLPVLVAIVMFHTVAYAQTVQLNSNGHLINLKEVDTLQYSEYVYPLKTPQVQNIKKPTVRSNKMKYATGIVTKPFDNIPDNNLSYSSKFYSYEDGTLQAPTQTLFLKPFNIDTFRTYYGNLGKIDEHPVLKGYYYLYVTDARHNTGESILNLCNQLYNEKKVDIIEPVFYKIITPENPLRPKEWNIKNSGSITGSVTGADMGVEEAWKYSTGTGIKVAVIDDGVDLKHPDLEANLLGGYDATGNNSGGGSKSSNAHGTNCAGIIASVNNEIGTIGVAYNSKIIPLRMGIVNNSGEFSTNDIWISNCFIEAVVRGADVISNSWGGGSPSEQITAGIEHAVKNGRGGKGCVILFAAGNNNKEVNYPAKLEGVIAVGASTPCDTRKRSSKDLDEVSFGVSPDPDGESCDGEKWWGSNFGPNLDILSPGVIITTTDNVGASGEVAGDYNEQFNGTSAACPNAAAVAALILSVNPQLTAQEARNILEQTCFKIPGMAFRANVTGQPNGTWCEQAGYGRVDAFRAVCKAASPCTAAAENK